MNTVQLQYLNEIAKNHSINIAARNLFMTPSALSTSIQKLEKELNVTLLERSHTGVTLTDIGIKILNLSNAFFWELNEIIQQKKENYTGELEIWFNNSTIESIFSHFIKEFYKTYPRIQLLSHEATAKEICQKVNDQTINIGFILHTAINCNKEIPIISNLEYHHLTDLIYIVEMNPANHLANRKSISIKELANQRLIAYLSPTDTPDNNSYSAALNLWELSPLKISYERNPFLITQMILSNMGVRICLIPTKQKLKYTKEFIQIPLKENYNTSCGYVMKTHYQPSELESLFLNAVIAYFTE